MTTRFFAAPTLALLLAGAASLAAAQGDVKPRAWAPGNKPPVSASDSARAEAAAAAAARLPTDHELPTPAGTTRTLDLMYQPSVPDSILPLVPVYRVVPIDGGGTVYMGALRQDLPVRPYTVFLRGSTFHAPADGETGQTHVAIMVMVPWFGDIMPLPRTQITLGVQVDDGAEQEWKLECTPGPNLYIPAQRPLPVSNPGLVLVPLPAGPHRLSVRVKKLDAAYALILIGQPRLTPLGIERR
jgi:hypothetical protein